MDVAWSFQNDCPADNTMTYSQGAFTVVQSMPNVCDTKILKHLGSGVFDNQLLELNASSGKSEFIRLGDQTGGFHAHRLVGTFTVTSTNPILKYNYAVALHDAGPNHDEATLGNTGRPYYTFRFKTGSDPTWTDIPCTEFTTVGAASPSSIFQTQDIYINPYVPPPTASPPYAMPNGFFVDWQQNIVDITAYIGQQVQVEISLVECNEGGHSVWLYVDMFCDSSTFNADNAEADTDDCQTYTFSTSYTGNYGDGNETYYWDFGDGNTSSDSNPTHTYSAPGSYNITLNSYSRFIFLQI